MNPPDNFAEYVEELIEYGFDAIIVVDDGSDDKHQPVFTKIGLHEECTVLRHAVNLGKGRGLKTGFNYYLNSLSEKKGLITVDSDGQHIAKDVVKMNDFVADLSGGGYCLTLGCRDFDSSIVPFKSRFGNKLTSLIFHLLYGYKISDTQTGLRGFTNDILPIFMTLAGERFEYETNMLIAARRKEISIEELPIETVYIDGNSETHFDAVWDSLKIYRLIFKEFFRFAAVSISSFVLDIMLFQCLLWILTDMETGVQIFAATVGARICSSIYNMLMNQHVVFKSQAKLRQIAIRYYLLCFIQMFCSAGLVLLIYHMTVVSKTGIKLCVDTCLFMISYYVQKNYIYR